MGLYSNNPESKLYRDLIPSLASDMLADGLFTPSQVETIIKWFDPGSEDYISRVDAWQKLLCAGRQTLNEDVDFTRTLVECEVAHVNGLRTELVLSSDVRNPTHIERVKRIHQIARLLIKFHGAPRTVVNMEDVKERLSHPGRITLTHAEIEGIKAELSKLNPPTWHDVYGSFGPGASSDVKGALSKWSFDGMKPARVPAWFWNTMAEDDFELEKLTHYACWPTSDDGPSLDGGKIIHRRRNVYDAYKYGVTHVAQVPKSLKTNRIVSSEPTMGMFAQLAIAKYLDTEIHQVFKGHVFLHNQARHSRLLLNSNYATIDLSDASDHVSRKLVHLLLPHWEPLFNSVRSTFARFPDGDLVPLRTFSPMGGGLCFQVLTTVMLGISAYAAKHHYQWYGDDGIVHRHDYREIVRLMEAAGLVVNTQKSCCTGFYREACGREIYCNVEITPVLLRDEPWNVDSLTIESTCRRLGGSMGIDWRDTRLHIMRLFYEQATRSKDHGESCDAARWSSRYQRWEVKGLMPELNVLKGVHSFGVAGVAGLRRWLSNTVHRNSTAASNDFEISHLLHLLHVNEYSKDHLADLKQTICFLAGLNPAKESEYAWIVRSTVNLTQKWVDAQLVPNYAEFVFEQRRGDDIPR